MAEGNEQLVDMAQQNRLLTRKQAQLIRDQLASEPGADAGELMLMRHYITQDQLAELREKLVNSGAPAMDVSETQRQAPVEPAHKAPEREPAADPPAEAPQPGRPAREPEPEKPKAQEPPKAKPKTPKTLSGLLRLARHWGCSDLHISAGRPPFVRLHGDIRYMEEDALSPERCEELNFSALNEEQRLWAVEELQLDFPLDLKNAGRFRCSIFKDRLGWNGSYRIIRETIPTFQDLGLPDTIRVLAEYTQGLALVTGPGGSGKTTTVAAMLDTVNANRREHIITVEDPVEYVIPAKSCQVTQREVGRHTESFSAALKAALREDPDIILIGELRDLDTTSTAISAAETGHLVFGTLHTGSALRTVSRIVDLYPANQQSQVRTMVAESLRGVVTQQLLPRRDQAGRALALEILINTSGVAQQIKEGKTHLLRSLIQGGKKLGMVLMEDSLMALCKQGAISGRQAYQAASHKQPFEAIKDQD